MVDEFFKGMLRVVGYGIVVMFGLTMVAAAGVALTFLVTTIAGMI